MRIAVANNRSGKRVGDYVRSIVRQLGHDCLDVETDRDDQTELPDLAYEACTAVAAGAVDRAILICASGTCMTISANKVKGIRASVCLDEIAAQVSRLHFDTNALCLSGAWLGEDAVKRIVEMWLATEFTGQRRHQRRIEKIHAIEDDNEPTQPLT